MKSLRMPYREKVYLEREQLLNLEKEDAFSVNMRPNNRGTWVVRTFSFSYEERQSLVTDCSNNSQSSRGAASYKFTIGRGILEVLRSNIPLELSVASDLTLIIEPKIE